MRDLGAMPVMAWPSVEGYDAYKRYWFPAHRLLESSGDVSKPDPEPLIKIYEGRRGALQMVLEASRR
jgi:hypothetical protein